MTDIVDCAADRILECIDGSRCDSPDPCLHLGEDVLDRIEVGTVRRQEQQAGTDCLYSLARFSTLGAGRLSRMTTSPGDSVGASTLRA